MTDLQLPHSGVLTVVTAATVYVLDFGAGTALRIPGAGAAGPGPHVANLRRDCLPLPLLGLQRLRWGRPMVLRLQVRPGVETQRTTTPVVDVRWASSLSTPVAPELALVVAGGLEQALAPALAHTRAWLDGTVRTTPHHNGPPCPETRPLLPELRQLNTDGLLTICSQPGGTWGPVTQRSYLSLLTSPGRAARLAVVLQRLGLLVDHWPLDHVPSGRGFLPVSCENGRPGTWALMPAAPLMLEIDDEGAALWRREHLTVFPGCRAVLEHAALLMVVDAQWGNPGRLFTAVVAAARAVQP